MPRPVPVTFNTGVPSVPSPNRFIAAARGVFAAMQPSRSSADSPADDAILPSTPSTEASMHRGLTDPLLPSTAAERHRPSRNSLNALRRSTLQMPSPQTTDAADGSQEDQDEDLPFTQPPEILNQAMPPPPPRAPTFSMRNAEYIPPDDSEYPNVPPSADAAISKMLHDVWGIEARPYQVRAIFFLAFVKVGMMYLVRKTGEGKSLVLIGTATILRGVTRCNKPSNSSLLLLPLLCLALRPRRGVSPTASVGTADAEDRLVRIGEDETSPVEGVLLSIWCLVICGVEKSGVCWDRA
eukprot:scaffold39396_cov76-Cyclotella_meneghiniana.AAC.1